MSAVATLPRTRPAPARDVLGPVAFGDSPRRFWILVRQDVSREFQLRYHNSILGFAWSIANPLLMFIVLYLWFSRIIRFGEDIPNFAALIIFNLMLFRFVSEAVTVSLPSLVAREGFVRRAQFPTAAVPMAKVMASLVDLLLSIPVLLVILVVVGVDPSWTWLGLSVIVALLWLLAIGAALLLSALYVFVRDVHQLWTVGTRVLFFATPILYPIEFAPGALKDVLLINPLAPIFTLARKWVVDPSAPGLEVVGGWTGLIAPTVVGVALCVGGLVYFRRQTPIIAESI